MGELVAAQPVIRLDSQVSLPVDFISTLSLLYRAVPGAGLDPWLVNARRTLPDETRYDLDILEGFSGRLLYYLEEPVTRFDPLAPANREATFADIIDFMIDLTPDDYLAMAVRGVQRVREDEGLDPTPPVLPDDPETRDLVWRGFLEPALTTATPDEIIPLLEDPAQLRLRTINLFRTVWQTVYRDEFLRQADALHAAAEHASTILHRGFGRAFGDLTGARLPSTLAARLHDISDITFHPSVHLGSYISFILSPPRGIIFFNAHGFMERQRTAWRGGHQEGTLGSLTDPAGPRSAALGVAISERATLRETGDSGFPTPDRAGARLTGVGFRDDPGEGVEGDGDDGEDTDVLIECARALGDPTRFRILEMLSGGEHYAQEIVSHLGIAQSAVSRHLSLLERSGLVSVRPQRGMKYYSVSEADVRRFARAITRRLLPTER